MIDLGLCMMKVSEFWIPQRRSMPRSFRFFTGSSHNEKEPFGFGGDTIGMVMAVS